MATSLYDLSIGSYLQSIGALQQVLRLGMDYCRENNIDPDTVVDEKLAADMLPFRFQVLSAVHHSMGTVRAFGSGEFGPPPSAPEMSYADLQQLVDNTKAELEAVSREDCDAAAGRSIVFSMGELKIPFTAENFVMSFSLPNVHFHITTAYDILRIKGVPLGKRDYLGEMRMGG